MIELVAIGASWGGLQAVGSLLASLPAHFGAAVVVAQHRRPDTAENTLAQLLDRRSALIVSEAEDKVELQAGRVLVAPPDYHLLVEPGAVALSIDARVHFSRPSIDVLMATAADAYGPRVAGVVLTGANADGADGLARIAARGGRTLVQDPDEAERRTMPAAALAAVPGAELLALADIGPRLVELAGAREEARS